MKTRVLAIVGLMAMVMTSQAIGQNTIKSEIDKLLNCKEIKYTERHSMSKDVKTGEKESQMDVYDFTLQGSKASVIDKIKAAFRADAESAYAMESGRTDSEGPAITLAVGDGSSAGVRVNEPGSEYIYACFLAAESESPEANYRYAYALSWKKEGGDIKGRIAITYATTLKYRQEKSQLSVLTLSSNTQSWFMTLMSYIQTFESVDSKMKAAIASKIYEHTKSIPEGVDESDKDLACEILIKLAENKTYAGSVNQLLNAAIENFE